MEGALKNLHGFVLLQALGGMLLLSFLCFALLLNIVALDDTLSCIEILAQAQLPDNLMLHYYDSALLAHGVVLRPKMPCAISRMLP